MASVRRSTRLSSIGGASAQNSTATPRGTPRRSAAWNRRQQAKQAVSDSEDDDLQTVGISKLPTAGIDLESDENNENCNQLNKMSASTPSRRGRKPKNALPLNAEPAKTPKSHSRPMPACKKRELAEKAKRKSDSDDSEQAAVDALQLSPTKQARRSSALPQHLISPSRLLNRLSIDERKHDSDEDTQQSSVKEDEEEQQQSNKPTPPRNKYQNARRVLNSAETEHLPGREQQLQELRKFFSEHLENNKSASLYVSGQPGTGKTACLSLLLRSAEFKNRLQKVYINCTSIPSVGAVYKKMCNELQLQPNGRTEKDHMLAIQKHLCSSKRMVLIVLDEVDQLCNARQSVLYTIFEWPALEGARLLLVGIANSLDLTDRALIRLNAHCELKPQLMHFPPYSKQQIVEIFRSRLEQADVLDVFPPVTLQLLAAKVSAVSGDVRRALDIGRRVVEIAEQQKNAGKKEICLKALETATAEGEEGKATLEEEQLKPVQITQVAAVLNKVYGASQNLQEDIEEAFPLQQKILLCCLMLMLRKERNKDITMGRLHEVYRRVCAKRNILALDQAEFAGAVDLVETRGILRIIRKKEPRLSKVTLQWDEEEVNAALCDKQLISSILNDTSCLAAK